MMPLHLGVPEMRHRERRRGPHLLPMTEPLGVTVSVWKPSVIALHLCATPKSHREGTTASHFAADDASIWSQAIGMGG